MKACKRPQVATLKEWCQRYKVTRYVSAVNIDISSDLNRRDLRFICTAAHQVWEIAEINISRGSCQVMMLAVSRSCSLPHFIMPGGSGDFLYSDIWSPRAYPYGQSVYYAWKACWILVETCHTSTDFPTFKG